MKHSNSKTKFTFKDGTVITGKDVQQAESELDAFDLFSTTPLLGRSSKRHPAHIEKEKVYSPNPETSEALLNVAASVWVNNSKARLSVKQLNASERAALKRKRNKVTKADVARAQEFRRNKGVLQSIAGRASGWTLLGVKSIDELNELLTKCYGADFAKEVLARAMFPRQLALALIAYQNKVAATSARGKKAAPKPVRRKSTKKA